MGLINPDTFSEPTVFTRDFAYTGSPLIYQSSTMDSSDNLESIHSMTFAELLSGPTIDVVVGPERRHWTIHLNLLRQQSMYFADQTQGNTTLSLPEDDPKGFALLVQWLYQKSLNYPKASSSHDEKYDHAVACHKLHVLAIKFQMYQLSNAAIDQYRICLYDAGLVPDAVEINQIYRSSPNNSPFKKLMVQLAARQIMDPETERQASSYRACFQDNTDFSVELFEVIRTMSGGMLFPDPTGPAVDSCKWHCHSDGSKCSPEIQANQSKQRLSRRSTRSDVARPSSDQNSLASSDISVPNNTPYHPQDSTPKRTVSQPQTTRPSIDSRRARSSAHQSPPKANRTVNGIVKRFDSMNVATALPVRSQGNPGATDGGVKKRKAPPKLRRGSNSTANTSAYG